MSTALEQTGTPLTPAGGVGPEATVEPVEATARAAAFGPAGPGVEVEVMSHFTGRWVSGFTIEESGEVGFRLRRTSDSSVLPVWFAPDEVRIATNP